jgi:pimeloyl-ACP methyl ester carboxylesterase
MVGAVGMAKQRLRPAAGNTRRDGDGALESRRAGLQPAAVQRRAMLVLWSVLLFLTGGLAVFMFFAQDLPFAEEYHRFNRVKKEAATAGNAVVYTRHNVKPDGTLRSAQPRQPWKTLVEPAVSPAEGALRVVYVHGFDTGFTESIAQGSYLARLLRQWTDRKPGGAALDFRTFSWRADFGPGEYATGLRAATAQAGALAAYLKSLAPAASGPAASPLVILAHGLGGQLALEALQRLEREGGVPPIEALILIQPAVRRIDVSKGTYETITGDAVSVVDYTGQYFEVIGRVRTVLATCSSTDASVAQFFSTDLNMPEDVPDSPKSYAALGCPYFSSTEAEVFPPNFRLIDLSPGRYLDMVIPGHHSIFDGSGRRALWSLWQRVLRQVEGR